MDLRAFSPRLTLAGLAAVATIAFGAAGCGVSFNGSGIDYAVEPQEFAYDFGTQMGTFPVVACSAQNMTPCTMIPNLPAGATASCDTGAGQCIATIDVSAYQKVNLSQQKTFPSAILNSQVISVVKVGAIHYWTPTNTLTVDSPAVGLSVGPQTAVKATDAGTTKLGAVPSLPKMQKTACSGGTPGTQASACDMPLTADGKNALAVFAREIRTPFNLIISATLTVRGGQSVPAGKIDFFLQPVLSFVL